MSFAVSKIVWLFFQPSNAIISVLLLSALASGFSLRWGKIPMMMAIAVLGLVTILPVGQWLLLPLEHHLSSPTSFPTEIDGAIVLGSGFDSRTTRLPDRIELSAAADRVTTLIALGRRYPDARLVYSGGTSDLFGGRVSEAEQARAFYQQQGFDAKRIQFEGRSRNTWENALNSWDLVKPSADQTWLLVTSARHMPRAVGVFRQLGWNVVPFPVDYRTARQNGNARGSLFERPDAGARLRELDLAAKEWAGLVAYWFMGRTPTLMPTSLHQR